MFDFTKRKKAENGAGRAVKIKHLLIPEELMDDLHLMKVSFEICYSEDSDDEGVPVPKKITYEQLLRHMINNVDKYDRKAAGIYKRLKETRQGVSKAHDVDPTVGKVWEMLYVFERNGEQIPAILGDMSPFYMTIDGDMEACLMDGWTLQNEIGVELDIDQAWKINRLIMDVTDINRSRKEIREGKGIEMDVDKL